jgi:hypothetical protein
MTVSRTTHGGAEAVGHMVQEELRELRHVQETLRSEITAALAELRREVRQVEVESTRRARHTKDALADAAMLLAGPAIVVCVFAIVALGHAIQVLDSMD